MSLTKEQVILEYGKCMKSTPYALKTYLQTYDNTVSKYVPLELFPDQQTLIEDYENFNENIALKYRQAGVSTVTAAWASKRLAFAKKTKPEKILIIANKLDTAVEMANKVRGFTEQWPSWTGIGFSAEKNSQRHFKLNNGCEVKAVATSKDALRGYTPTILIFDEAAYIEADSDFWAACMASLSTGGKVIVISTPNGFDPIYYEIYDQALRNMNEFKVSEMVWFKDPRYSKDLSLVKVNDIIHFYLNRDEYPEFESVDYSSVPFKERNFEDIKALINQGYKPTSSWYESMVKKLKYDRRKVNQELECKFLGSGDNVFDAEMLQNYRSKPSIKLSKYKVNPKTDEVIPESEKVIDPFGITAGLSREEKEKSLRKYKDNLIEKKMLPGRSLESRVPGGSLLSRAAAVFGILRDENNKFRCPPGTPAANQFTDATGSKLFWF